MKNKLMKSVAAVAMATICLIGCTSFDISAYQYQPQKAGSVIYNGCLYDNHLWNGYLWECEWMGSKSQTNTLYAVTVEQNYLYSLATVASLGFWAPVAVSWSLNEDNPMNVNEEFGQ